MNPPSPSFSGQSPQKKGLPPLAWVGIGCGGLVVIGIVIAVCVVWWGFGKVKELASTSPWKRGADVVLKMNPDLEKVSENEKTGQVTVRVKKTGEQVTLSYQDLAKGKITVTDAQGKVVQLGGGDLSKIPAWVPRYAGAQNEVIAVQVEDGSKLSGIFSFQTKDSETVLAKFYDLEATKLSFSQSGSTSFNLNGEVNQTMDFSSKGKSLTITMSRSAGEDLNVQVSYTESK